MLIHNNTCAAILELTKSVDVTYADGTFVAPDPNGGYARIASTGTLRCKLLHDDSYRDITIQADELGLLDGYRIKEIDEAGTDVTFEGFYWDATS